MAEFAYIPPQPVMGREDWPTLREFIQSGKRVIVFLDKGADNRTNPEREYILPQFKMVRGPLLRHCLFDAGLTGAIRRI
jgi:hypothetical protein